MYDIVIYAVVLMEMSSIGIVLKKHNDQIDTIESVVIEKKTSIEEE